MYKGRQVLSPKTGACCDTSQPQAICQNDIPYTQCQGPGQTFTVDVDCDADAVLLKVKQIGGAACHEGYESCFFRELTGEEELRVVGERVFDPKTVYHPANGAT